MKFTIEKTAQHGLARAGKIETSHGIIETPAFVGVATKATVKGIQPEQFKELGLQAVIGNTYHLYLSGLDAVEKAGGLSKFMGVTMPTMTDSGGFQIFSLGVAFGKKISKFLPEQRSLEEAVAVYDEDLATSHGKLAIVDEEGVSFTSHVDGSLHRFTPERSIEIQHRLGADIIFAFDECTSPLADYEYQKEAMNRTHAWADRSLKAHFGNLKKKSEQAIYGIVQGGRYEDLRIESAKTIANMDFDGYGIGGSFSKEDILGILDKVNRELPEERPRHLLGIGEPEDIFIGVEAGIDTFDCVLPTRNGRGGTIYTKRGKVNLKKTIHCQDFGPLDEGCECPVCKLHTRAYVHNLFRSDEMLGPILASMHNIYFLANLVKNIRQSIQDGVFDPFKKEFLSKYQI